MSLPRPHIIGLLIFLALPAFLRADGPAPWQDLAASRFSEALAGFQKQPSASVDAARLAKLGQAAALLSVQPLTEGNIDLAASLLEELSKSQDDMAIEATYLLARVEHLHRFAPNHGRALALYDQLAAEHPTHPLAQQAIVKASILRIFSAKDRPSLLATFAQIETLESKLTDRDAHRDFHLALADASTLLQISDGKSLAHLLAADRAGFARRLTAATVYVRIGELARKLHRPAIALHYDARFLVEFTRDPRRFLVAQHLAEVLASAPFASP